MNIFGMYLSENAQSFFLKGFVVVLMVVLIFFLLNQLRFYIKRLKFVCKLKKSCKEKGYRIIKNTPFSLFKGRRIKSKCDFYIETENELLSVKLLGAFMKSKTLVFLDENKYCFRVYSKHRRPSTGQLAYSDGVKHRFKEIDFNYGKRPVCEKQQRNILLLNPTPFKVEVGIYKTAEYSDGDKIYNFYFYSSGLFIKKLKTEFDFKSADRVYNER